MPSGSRENTDSRPQWVNQRRFVIPTTLQNHIRNVPEEVMMILCSIVSKIVITTQKHPEHFANILRDEFKNIAGNNYRQYLNQLDEDFRIIDINERYSNAEGKRFPKSYRLRTAARQAGKVKISVQKKMVQPLRDRSHLTNDVAKFVHRNLKRLTVRTDLLPQANIIDEVNAEDWAERIYFQQFNVHYSAKAKRLYHTVITMPKIARKNLILKVDTSVPLFEYDIKSCMPVILLGLIQEPAERTKLTGLLDGDIYSTVANECGVTKDRDDIKEDFLKFLNGAVQNYFYTYFHTHMPRLTKRVMAPKKTNKGMAWFGQRVESEIMAEKVPRQLMATGTPSTVQNQLNSLICVGNPDDDFLYIPMHDGWLGIERDEQRIASMVRNEFYQWLGYWVTITKKKLATNEEAVLASGVPVYMMTATLRNKKPHR